MVDLTKPVAIMCFSSGAGGMEMSAINLANLLSKVTAVVLVCKKDSFVENLYHDKKQNYICESIKFSSRTFSIAMLLKARDLVCKYEVRNVVFLGASELKTLHFSFLGLPINLIVLHGTTKSKSKKDFFHKVVYSNVNYHVAVSEYLLRNVRRIVPDVDSERYKVIRLSYNHVHSRIEKNANTADYINIIHVGRIVAGKGQVDAVLACKLLKAMGVRFKLIFLGDSAGSNYVFDVKEAIRVNGLESMVILAGHVKDVASYLENADIMLFPSRGEGLSLAFVEALHYNIVCIAYDNTVFPEYIGMGFYLHLVPDGDIPGLSNKLLQVASNLVTEKQMAFKNHERARECFNPERELNEWLEILV